MQLRESKGNMYGFVTHTWNPIKGRCLHDCPYCYMKQWGERPATRLVEKELGDLGKDKIIFVGSGTDMFASNIPSEWIETVLQHCYRYPENEYLFQTKNPSKFRHFVLPAYSHIGTTIETNRFHSWMKDVPPPTVRAVGLASAKESILTNPFNPPIKKTFVTIEPIMDFDMVDMVTQVLLCKPDQVNIGADSKGSGLPEPSKEKILTLISKLEKQTIVHQKANLKRLLK